MPESSSGGKDYKIVKISDRATGIKTPDVIRMLETVKNITTEI